MKRFIAGFAAALCAAAALAQAVLPVVEGEVRKVNLEGKTITLRHGEIQNLGMTGMTMVFHVSNPALLGKVKAGDKVRFTADKVDGTITVVSIEPVN